VNSMLWLSLFRKLFPSHFPIRDSRYSRRKRLLRHGLPRNGLQMRGDVRGQALIAAEGARSPSKVPRAYLNIIRGHLCA